MEYIKFEITQYKGIKGPLDIDISKNRLIPLVGINECGKTTILKSIFCFDYINDKAYDGNHLERLENLYSSETGEQPKICAFIRTSKKEFLSIIDKIKEDGTKVNILEDTYQQIQALENFDEIKITRDLISKKYSIDVLDFINPDAQNIICKEILRSELPYILYNDDFNDRPASNISIDQSNKTEWLEIYERVFKDAGHNLYDVLEEKNEEKRATIIDNVVLKLNNNLTKTWNKFKLGSLFSKLKISLKVDVVNKMILVKIIEEKNGQNYHFKIDDRSKGFIWYYNFTMKLMYNPKYVGKEDRTIFLLDEPGSYLHANAQDNLCQKLMEISQKNGIVIYCTHSHHMLNPQYVPLNNILIVQKQRKNLITLDRATQINTDIVKNNAFQPIYEALQLPFYSNILKEDLIIAVEGIYDKYAIELFGDLDSNMKIFPSTSCEDIIKNIPYFILYNIKYIIIWDNDGAGRNSKEKARSIFGEEESKKFQTLHNRNQKDRRMEEMFENDDINKIREKLKLPEDSKYETILSTLYYSKFKSKAKEWISEETKKNFEILMKIIHKTFENNEE